QATGYAVVVLSIAGLALSVRKRGSHLGWADLPALRVVHGALGAGAVVCLAAHTGLHLGQRMNRLLMIDFLALSVLGALAAAVTAFVHRLDPARAQARRELVARAH